MQTIFAAPFHGILCYANCDALIIRTKTGINTVVANDQRAFDPATNLFTAPAAGTCLFGASLLYKAGARTSARMRGRPVLNGTTGIRGSFGEVSISHKSLATALWLQIIVPLTVGDTVELRGCFRAAEQASAGCPCEARQRNCRDPISPPETGSARCL